jgi:hypothetical protein
MPSRHETQVGLLQVEFLQAIGRSTAPTSELGVVAIDALARTVAAMIGEAPDYHAALDLFREYLDRALLAEG